MSLEFYYGAMNVGKSAALLQMAHNIKQNCFSCSLWIPKIIGENKITSRTGISSMANVFDNDHIFTGDCDYILIDEAQFLTIKQVKQLSKIAIEGVHVMCYGLRTDFQGNVFEGSSILLGLADKLKQMEGMCFCGSISTMNARINHKKEMVVCGPVIDVDASAYVSLCRYHWLIKSSGSTIKK